MATTLDEVRQELGMAEARVIDARRSMDSVEATLQSLIRSVPVAYPPLNPRPETTDELVARLLADPRLAEIVSALAFRMTEGQRFAMVGAIRGLQWGSARRQSLTTFAAAIAAASLDPRGV
jgi:hypothetical protein